MALQVADVAWVEDGIRLRIRRSKTDQERGSYFQRSLRRLRSIKPLGLLTAMVSAVLLLGTISRARRYGKGSQQPLPQG